MNLGLVSRRLNYLLGSFLLSSQSPYMPNECKLVVEALIYNALSLSLSPYFSSFP